MRFSAFGTLLLLLLTGCAEAPEAESASESAVDTGSPALTNGADSLAWRITEAAGGLTAWAALPRLRFDFAVVNDSTERFRAKHLWDRTSDRFRAEYPVGEDSVLVALFDVRTFNPEHPTGRAAINGVAVDSTQTAMRLADAYERFINDSYWLLAPLKLFDPGVHRALVPDSADAETEVLLLSFENVGLTPGDRYWLRADASGRLVSWTFLLKSGNEGHYRWEDYAELPTPAGTLHLTQRKVRNGRAILTEVFPADSLDRALFDDLNPRL